MQVWHNFIFINKLLIYGIYKEGIKVLAKSVFEHWISVIIVLSLLVYLCSNPKTYFIAWILVGAFALFAVIKAIYEIIILLILYNKTTEKDEKDNIIISIGGKIFDIAISAIGVLQAGKILKHSVRIAHAANSAFSLVDDVGGVISKIVKDLFK